MDTGHRSRQVSDTVDIIPTRINAQRRRTPISEQLTPEEQVRFHNLLKLAKESPFPGERENALAAAERMATRHGLTLEEAATGNSPSKPSRSKDNVHQFAQDLAAYVHMTD